MADYPISCQTLQTLWLPVLTLVSRYCGRSLLSKKFQFLDSASFYCCVACVYITSSSPKKTRLIINVSTKSFHYNTCLVLSLESMPLEKKKHASFFRLRFSRYLLWTGLKRKSGEIKFKKSYLSERQSPSTSFAI